MMSFKDACKYLNLSRQHLNSVSRKWGLTRIKRKDGEIEFLEEEVEEYKKNRYNKNAYNLNRKLLFDESKGEISVKNAALKYGVPTYRIYDRLKSGALIPNRKGRAVVLNISDLEKNLDILRKQNRYDTKFDKRTGELLFDETKGEISLRDASLKYNVPKSRLYYLVYRKLLRCKRKGSSCVLDINDLEKNKDLIFSFDGRK